MKQQSNYSVNIWRKHKNGHSKFMGVAGYVYKNSKCEQLRDDKLWLGGSNWCQAFFRTKEEAEEAIRLTEGIDREIGKSFFCKIQKLSRLKLTQEGKR